MQYFDTSVLVFFARLDVEDKLLAYDLLIHIKDVLRRGFKVRCSIVRASYIKVVFSRFVCGFMEVGDRNEDI